MKFVTILASLVLVLGVAATASADFTWSVGGGYGGSWSGAWSPQYPNNITGEYPNSRAELANLNLQSTTPASEISAGGGFVVEYDLTQVPAGGNWIGFYIAKGAVYPGNTYVNHFNSDFAFLIRGNGDYVAFDNGGGAGSGSVGTLSLPDTVKVEVVTDSDFAAGDNVTVRAFFNGVQFIDDYTFGVGSQSFIGFAGPSTPAGIDNFSITPLPEPATVAILGFGSLVLLRKRR